MTADQFYMTLTIFFITYSIFGETDQALKRCLIDRGPVQCIPQKIQASPLASSYYGLLGRHAAMDGLRKVLRRASPCESVAWRFRGRTFPRSQLLPFMLVQTE
jgi:hypothetical protein